VAEELVIRAGLMLAYWLRTLRVAIRHQIFLAEKFTNPRGFCSKPLIIQ
jgi:hypothetical protein